MNWVNTHLLSILKLLGGSIFLFTIIYTYTKCLYRNFTNGLEGLRTGKILNPDPDWD